MKCGNGDTRWENDIIHDIMKLGQSCSLMGCSQTETMRLMILQYQATGTENFWNKNFRGNSAFFTTGWRGISWVLNYCDVSLHFPVSLNVLSILYLADTLLITRNFMKDLHCWCYGLCCRRFHLFRLIFPQDGLILAFQIPVLFPFLLLGIIFLLLYFETESLCIKKNSILCIQQIVKFFLTC